MELDALALSRFQFALTIMFHYLFPPLSIGLGWMMVIMEGMYLKTGNREYEAIARFWTSIFAVVFAMGVATGIVMEFEFGTNWANYSRYVGDVFGSALAAEGIFAFFLESGFLAVLVFGWDRVSPRMHFFSTVMVAVGALFSSVWITVANSWQQTPAGHHIVGEWPNARAEIVDFWAMVFNPSSVHRLVHVWIAALILGAFFILSISAYYILKRRHVEPNNVATTQPAKLAPFEGHFKTGEGGAPLYLFGWPDEEAGVVKLGLGIPGGLSFLIHEDFTTPVPGLDEFPREDWPPVWLSFQTYHIMVALGMYFIALTLLAAFLLWRGTLFETRWLLWVIVFSVIGPYIANQFGWAAAEVGRQPWIVYGLLRTRDALSPVLSAEQILGSIVMFSVLYSFLLIIWLYVMNLKIRKGPAVREVPTEPTGGLLETVARSADRAGPSLTAAREADQGEADNPPEE